MTTLFGTRILREASTGRTRILDAGCGTGIQAVYLARRKPSALVHGYDTDPKRIAVAECYKQKYRIPNVTFAVASHDYFQPPHTMDMIYTTDSLVGDNEIPVGRDPLLSTRGIVVENTGLYEGGTLYMTGLIFERV